MNLKKTLGLAFALCLGIALSAPLRAEEGESKQKNLQVLAAGKEVEAGMKLFSKGIGVKCNACHIKGEFDSDKMSEKLEARKFLQAVLGEKDAAKKDTALKTLLSTLKVTEIKSADDLWKGVDTFKKK